METAVSIYWDGSSRDRSADPLSRVPQSEVESWAASMDEATARKVRDWLRIKLSRFHENHPEFNEIEVDLPFSKDELAAVMKLKLAERMRVACESHDNVT